MGPKRKGKKADISTEVGKSQQDISGTMETATFYGRGKQVEESTKKRQSSTERSSPEERPAVKSKQKELGPKRSTTDEGTVREKSTHSGKHQSSVERSSKEGSQDPATREDEDIIPLHDLDSDEESPKATPQGRRRKGSTEERHFLFTPEIEDDLIDWWRENTFLYNQTLPEYLDKGKKNRALQEKADAIGCSKSDLITRMHSLRTDFGRILRVGPSGRGVDGEIDPNKLHVKDKAIWDRMCFLKDFIIPRQTVASTKFVEISSSDEENKDVTGEEGKKKATTPTIPRQVRATYTPARKKGKVSTEEPGSSMDLQILDKVSQISSQIQARREHDESKTVTSSQSPEEKECDTFIALIRVKLMKLPAARREELLEQFLSMTSAALRQYEQQRSTAALPQATAAQALPSLQQTFLPQMSQQPRSTFVPPATPYQAAQFAMQQPSTTGFAPTGLQQVLRQQMPYVQTVSQPNPSFDYMPQTPGYAIPTSQSFQTVVPPATTTVTTQAIPTATQQIFPQTPDPNTVSSFVKQLPDLPITSSVNVTSKNTSTTSSQDEDSGDLPYDFLN